MTMGWSPISSANSHAFIVACAQRAARAPSLTRRWTTAIADDSLALKAPWTTTSIVPERLVPCSTLYVRSTRRALPDSPAASFDAAQSKLRELDRRPWLDAGRDGDYDDCKRSHAVYRIACTASHTIAHRQTMGAGGSGTQGTCRTGRDT